MRDTFGNVSLTSSSRLPAKSEEIAVSPVIFPTWPCKTCDKSTANRIKDVGHDNWDRIGRLLSGASYSISTCGDDNIHFETCELGCELRKSIHLSLCKAVFDDNILIFHVPQLVQSLPECLRSD